MSKRGEELEKRNLWDELLSLRDRHRDRIEDSIRVVKGKELPWEVNQQGIMRWYLHPAIDDTVIRSLIVYVQEIPPGSRTGQIKFQGGQVIYIIQGQGHTILDGERHDWEARDVLNLPMRRNGITVQHFNDDPDIAVRFVTAEPNTVDMMGVDRGSGFEQIEPSPEYTGG